MWEWIFFIWHIQHRKRLLKYFFFKEELFYLHCCILRLRFLSLPLLTVVVYGIISHSLPAFDISHCWSSRNAGLARALCLECVSLILFNACCNVLSESLEDAQIKFVSLLKQFGRWEKGSWAKTKRTTYKGGNGYWEIQDHSSSERGELPGLQKAPALLGGAWLCQVRWQTARLDAL